MKKILLHNWKIKLTCLALAAVVWYVIQRNITPAGEGYFGTRLEQAEK